MLSKLKEDFFVHANDFFFIYEILMKAISFKEEVFNIYLHVSRFLFKCQKII